MNLSPNSDLGNELLSHTAFVQRLARSLVRDAHRAEDLAQEVLVESLQRPPSVAVNLKAWLATVLRRRVLHEVRGTSRRAAREAQAARPPDASVDESAEQRVQQHQRLVQLVHELDEPYRTALVLQFLEELPPRAIAKRLGVPVNTVRSRVQRGLAQLRARLEREHGGREEWVAALAPLAWPRLVAGSASTASTGVWILMHVKLIGVVAVSLCIALVLWWWREHQANPAGELNTQTTARIEAYSTAPSAPATNARVAPPDSRRVLAPAAPNTAPARNQGRGGRVVDLLGRPLAGLCVRWMNEQPPRWQGGDLGWVSDNQQSRYVSQKELEELRQSASAAQRFFADIERPEAWRALLLGTALPERETLCDENGAFFFAGVPEEVEVEVAEAGWLTLAQARDARGEQVCIAAPCLEVAGTVLGLDGSVLGDADVEFRFERELALARLPRDLEVLSIFEVPEINVDEQGRYLLRLVPGGLLGAEVVAHAAGQESEAQSAPLTSTASLDFRLGAAARERLLDVSGRVVDAAGQPVAEAEVIFGRHAERSAADGSFSMRGLDLDPRALLTVLAQGFAPLQRENMVAQLQHSAALREELVLVLAQPARTLRGVVLGRDGLPVAEARIGLYDPSLLDYTFAPVEARLGGWPEGASTDERGRFELAGLFRRSYRLRVWLPKEQLCFVSESVAPETEELVLRADQVPLHASVHGRVLAVGSPLPDDLEISVVFTVHVTRSGSGSMTVDGQSAKVAPDGSFELRGVPLQHAMLVLRSRTQPARVAPVEAIDDSGRIEIPYRYERVLRILSCGGAASADLSVLDGEDHPLEVLSIVGGVELPARLLTTHDGIFPPLRIPAEARAVLVERVDGSWERVLIGDDDSGLSQVVLRL